MSVRVHTGVAPIEADVIGYTPYWRKFTFTYADLNASDAFSVPIDAGSHVMGVALLITAAFDVATAVVVGDSGDADEFIASGSVDPTSLNAFYYSPSGSADAANGKYYAATDRLIVDLNGNPTVGAGELRVLFSGMEE